MQWRALLLFILNILSNILSSMKAAKIRCKYFSLVDVELPLNPVAFAFHSTKPHAACRMPHVAWLEWKYCVWDILRHPAADSGSWAHS